MCLSLTNTLLHIYINVYLACTVDSISLSITALDLTSLGQSPFALPKGVTRGPLLLPLACRQHTFCVLHREELHYIWLSLAPTILFNPKLKS